MKFESYTIEPNGIKNICKSPSAWGCCEGTNSYIPIAYFKKPKWMSGGDFKEVVKQITINIPKDKDF